ncbi:MAG TPA: hypothetical protein PJ982_12250, partial [Lacipirellulaceae bacterium]|nr:hypothetical protein [Lacipirellulaceae bacterium]
VPLRGGGIALVPGALVDNLTSQGAVLSRTQGPQAQTRVSEYIRLGAAGASGTVVEPFAITQKFPTPALHVHYGRGSSLAEAFYQSVEGPFQLLVVGDPLCQPWAAIPEVTGPDVKEGQLLAGEGTLAPPAKLAAGRNGRRWELFVDGKRRQERPGGGSFV